MGSVRIRSMTSCLYCVSLSLCHRKKLRDLDYPDTAGKTIKATAFYLLASFLDGSTVKFHPEVGSKLEGWRGLRRESGCTTDFPIRS